MKILAAFLLLVSLGVALSSGKPGAPTGVTANKAASR